MSLRFLGSPEPSLGIEFEVGIVDDATDELTSAGPAILAESGHPDRLKAELFESTLELVTGICRSPGEAHADLSATIARLGPALRARNVSLIGGGVHPFSGWEQLRVTREERYERMVQRFRWPVRRLTIFGTHFHVGVPTGDHAIAVQNGLTRLLPHLVALSASSPFWHGQDTGLASVRTTLWESVPLSGVPPQLADWDDFERLYGLLLATGTIQSTRDLWWDIRPSPHLGTVELRMCDSMATLAEVCAVAGLAQAAVAHLSAGLDGGEVLGREPDWVLQENKWRASRYGLGAELVRADGTVGLLRDDLREWVERVRPQARALGSEIYLDQVLGLLAGDPSYARQRAIVQGGGDLHDVVDLLRREFAGDPARATCAPAVHAPTTAGPDIPDAQDALLGPRTG